MGDKITIARKRDDNFVEWTVEWDGETLSVGTGEWNPVTVSLDRLPDLLADIERVASMALPKDPHHDQ